MNILVLLGMICFVLAISLSITLPSRACIWDSDTLEMERQEFPEVLEIITGKFLRHSADFYHWRIKDRLEKLKQTPNQLNLYDDLAVAYEKVGKTDKAIETMLKKEKLKPGLYKTYANLGTFYFHDKQWAKGIEMIKKAIEINPNAHFGREKYQLLLAEYIVDSRTITPDKTLLMNISHSNMGSEGLFVYYLKQEKDFDIKSAIKGILGMMHFGNYDSPVLLGVLGDLLEAEKHHHLAARAYLKASMEVKEEQLSERFRTKAYEALSTQENMDIEQLIPIFKKEIKEAENWFLNLTKDEQKWITSETHPEEAYKKKYYQTPEIEKGQKLPIFAIQIGALIGLIVLLAMIVILKSKRKGAEKA